jgi:SAM-dependent methyltransferase
MPTGPSVYYDESAMRSLVQDGGHRRIVGGLWEEMGSLQLNQLIARGMVPGDRLLDVGCGSLRLGRLACAYLDPGHYWGTDISPDLVETGYQQEILSAGLQNRLPRTNLVIDAEFGFAGLPTSFDFIMAQSVFTHLSLNHMRLCFANLAGHLTGPCKAYFTIFMPVAGVRPAQPSAQKDGVVSWSYKDPFHYEWDDIRHAFRGLPWHLSLIGDWAHPRNQMLVEAVLGNDASRMDHRGPA